MEAICNVPRVKDEDNKKGVQSKVYKLILPIIRKETPEQVLRRKFSKYFEGDVLELAIRRVPIVIQAVKKAQGPIHHRRVGQNLDWMLAHCASIPARYGPM